LISLFQRRDQNLIYCGSMLLVNLLNRQIVLYSIDYFREKQITMKSKLFIIKTNSVKRIAVIGDLHGDYKTLLYILKVIKLSEDFVIFLGDYADRGLRGIETIKKIDFLIQTYPKNIIALKGNHEDYNKTGLPNFSPWTLLQEAQKKIGDWKSYFVNEFRPFINRLYLAAVIPNETLFVHGGISSKLLKLEDLLIPQRALEQDILWSDPFEGYGERANHRGVGVEFGANVTSDVCNHLKLKRIIRSHQPTLAMSEPIYSHAGKVVTVNSTRVYGGSPFVFFIDPLNFNNSCYINLP
jgi:hypothetical protein